MPATATPKTMKEVFVLDRTLRTEIRDSPIPQPADDEVLVRVITTSSNPKDWKWIGDDLAGYVHAVGKNVYEFKPGDRVAAFHQELDLPLPWHPRKDTDPEIPLIIYGGSTAVGAFALKLAKLSNIHPVIIAAGKGQAYVESLKAADHIINYRETKDVTAAIKTALGARCRHHRRALHTIMVWSGTCTSGKIIANSKNWEKPEVGRDVDFGFIFYRYFGFLLQQGRFSGHPQKVLGGLDKVGEGLKLLYDNKVSAEKLVYRVAKE
ncbi:hypothetical protein DFS34DRAFT_697455 [Phlyctochytrium arcticum]|nr:hypothetical protein DFS34DRAFT_697455 [Phlyctochytrium arcticum]